MAQYGSMTLREREDKNRFRKRNDDRSQDGFETGIREVKKLRKLNSFPKRIDRNSRAKYDANGFDKETGLDICDCLIDNCPGCWMDCPNCGSRKCGHECRQYRRYKYENVDIEGTKR